jgi:hypothetical protein
MMLDVTYDNVRLFCLLFISLSRSLLAREQAHTLRYHHHARASA